MTDPEGRVTVAQAAALLGVTPSTIYSWRRRRLIAPVARLADRTQLYRLDELERTKAEDGRRRKGAAGLTCDDA